MAEVGPYQKASGGRLCQGDILCGVVERTVHLDNDGEPIVDEVTHPLAILITQDCDLEQDHAARVDENPKPQRLLTNLLFLAVSNYDDTKVSLGGSDIAKRVRQNKDERYQYLAAISQSMDLDEIGTGTLIVDFKRFFVIAPAELRARIADGEGRVRARLASPYVEQVAVRFGYFGLRVPLPRDHHEIE